MEILLAILMYLQVIFAGGEYYQSDIQRYEIIHQEEINAVKEDPEQMSRVEEDFLPQVESITILDDSATK